jgi:hypothetical protein
MTPDQMRQLVDEMLDTQFLTDRSSVDQPRRGQPGPPASAVDLQRLATHLASHGIAFPPSYLQFLSLFDGIEGFRRLESFDLRSVAVILSEAEDDEEELEDFAPVNRFVIGTGYATAVVGFDPSSVDPLGEMKVVEFSVDGDATEHASFEAFLQFNLELFREILAREQADRAGLADD